MGFDIECIIDIQTYPGEYFCPVCRTLVYPNEALQSQCTHLYCKPCLAHVANSTRACPYDGYLVTEADSKSLLESDKALAENIGKVVVRCLYHRSGCTWQGQLSECPSHCSTCSFGNSPVVCNRCGVQIIHRQVHEHAQNCPGVNQAQQATGASQDAASSVSNGAPAVTNQNQPSVVSGSSSSLPQVSQVASALLPGQGSTQQANAGSQALAAVPASVPTQEQLYQQQYQQYYQQYGGYAAYQQAYQQYYPYQQSTVQPQQQQPNVHPQTQVQPYAQAPVQVPPQPQPQPQIPTPMQPQSQQHSQSQSQPGQHQPVQGHTQIQPQGQLQNPGYTQPVVPQNLIQPQVNPPKQVHPAMPSHAAAPTQSTLAQGFPAAPSQQYNQSQSNVMQPLQQQQVQAIQYQQSHLQYPPSHSTHPQQPQPQPQFQSQPQPQFQSQPQPQPQFQSQPQPHFQPQPQLQFQPQPQLQFQPQSQHQPQPQSQHQPQPQPQHQPQPQPQPQSHSQILPQPHLQNQPPSQPSNPVSLNNPAQLLHTSAHAVSGHQSYPQAQTPQNAQFQQQPYHTLPTSGAFPPGQMQSQISQQPAVMVPPSSHAPVSNQQAPFASQVQVSGMPPSQQHQFHSQVPHTSNPVQQRPMVNSNQQPFPQQYAQQQPASGIGQAQYPPYSQFTNQQGLQPQLRPQAPPNLMQQSSHVYPQSQENTMMAPNLRPQQNSTYAGQPINPIQGATAHPQPFPQSSAGYGPSSQIRPDHPGSYQPPLTQNSVNNVVSDQHFVQYGTTTSGQMQKYGDHVSDKAATKDSGILSKSTEKSASALRSDSGGPNPFTSEAGMSNQIEPMGRNMGDIKLDDTLSKDGESGFQGGKDRANEFVSERIVKEEATSDSLEQPLNGKFVEASQKEAAGNIVTEEQESQKNEKAVLPKESGESLHCTTGLDKGPHNISSPSKPIDRLGGNHTAPSGRPQLHDGRSEQYLQNYGPSTFQQKPSGSVIPQSGPPFGAPPGPPALRPEGLGILPQPRSSLNEPFTMPLMKQPHDVSLGGNPGPMSSHWMGPGHLGAPGAPPLSGVNQHDGIMGRGPQYLPEGQFGLPNSGNPAGQRFDHFDGDHPNIPGSIERRPFGPPPGGESNDFRNIGRQGDKLSSHRSHDEMFNTAPMHLNSFSKGPTWPSDQGPGTLDRVHGFDYEMDSRFGAAGGPPPRNMLPLHHGSGSFGSNDPRDRELAVGVRDNIRGRMDPNGPGGEYFGHATHGFPPGSPRAHRGRMGREEFDGRDIRTDGYMRRPELDGPERHRFGDYGANGPTPNNFRRGDLIGQDPPPGHFQRIDHLGRGNSPNHLRFGDPGFGPFPGHARDTPGPGKFQHNMHIGESFGGNKPGLPHFGEPGFRSSFSLDERRKDGHYAPDMDPFDKSRKRKSPSMGWCRICEVDCETVEGLDMHSQTREHQKMAMDMVKAIKQQNKKKPRLSNARAVREETNKTRNSGVVGHGGIMP